METMDGRKLSLQWRENLKIRVDSFLKKEVLPLVFQW